MISRDARFLFSLVITAILLSGCAKPRRNAIGSFNAVYTFVDNSEIDILKESIEIALAREIQTPQKELLFRVIFREQNDFENATRHHIVLIIASINSNDDWGRYIRENLSSEALEGVKEGELNIFIKKDVWAKKQIFIIVTARSVHELRAYLLTNGEGIFTLVNNFCNEHVGYWLFDEFMGKSEKFELIEKIIRTYGFAIRIPRMFDWEKGLSKNRFLWLRAIDPERWVFVYWEPLNLIHFESPSLIWLANTRDSLCAIYYEGDQVVRNKLVYERKTIAGLSAINYRGMWKNRQKNIGGPMFGYIIDDIKHNRRYILDGAVFAPGARKEPYLRHCEIIMNTFNPDGQGFMDSLEILSLKKGKSILF